MNKNFGTKYKRLQARAKSLLMDLETFADEYELSLPGEDKQTLTDDARVIEVVDQLAWLEDIVNFDWDNPV